MTYGIAEIEKGSEPLRELPPDVKGLKIALKITGGIGDVIMALGGSAQVLSEAGAICTAVARSYQHTLLLSMQGITDVLQPDSNWLRVQDSFDVLIEFAGTFNSARQLKSQEYYSLVSERLGRSVGPGLFPDIKWESDGETIAIHPAASNPNRRWTDQNWMDVVYKLRDRGHRVVFLGTSDEYGFSDRRIWKASEDSEDLMYQIMLLRTCQYFIGCDSGFAHIAGVLGMPGLVLFGNTAQEDVIHRYDLRGINAFGSDVPNRTLLPDDPYSRDMMNRIKPAQVIAACDVKCLVWEDDSDRRRPVEAIKPKLVFVGSDLDELVRPYHQYYDVRIQLEVPEFDLAITPDGEVGELSLDGRTVRINLLDFESVRRALREVRNG